MSEMHRLIFLFLEHSSYIKLFLKSNGIFEWGNFFMTQGAWLWRQDLRYSIMTYQVLIELPGVKKEINHTKTRSKWNACICWKPQKTLNEIDQSLS